MTRCGERCKTQVMYIRFATGGNGDRGADWMSTRRSRGLEKSRERMTNVSFSCVVQTQRRWSKKNYKTQLTKTRYNNQVLGKYRVDPQRAGLTLIAELTWSNLGLKGVLNKIK